MGNNSAELIANALGTDQYLRAIYLNDNKIENPSCKKFIYMMRKNLCLLTIDLRNNPGYDEYIHSRLVMKMSKNIRYLYQQYKKGEYSEEEFENYKEFIDALKISKNSLMPPFSMSIYLRKLSNFIIIIYQRHLKTMIMRMKMKLIMKIKNKWKQNQRKKSKRKKMKN